MTDNEPDLAYDIELPYDMPTNSRPQIATLKEAAMDTTYRYCAAFIETGPGAGRSGDKL